MCSFSQHRIFRPAVKYRIISSIKCLLKNVQQQKQKEPKNKTESMRLIKKKLFVEICSGGSTWTTFGTIGNEVLGCFTALIKLKLVFFSIHLAKFFIGISFSLQNGNQISSLISYICNICAHHQCWFIWRSVFLYHYVIRVGRIVWAFFKRTSKTFFF